jgi:hypothetical protein
MSLESTPMSKRLRFVVAIATTTLFACGVPETPASRSANPAMQSFSLQELESLYRAVNVVDAGNGQVINACGEAVTPQVHSVDMSGVVGTAVLVAISGGEESPGCYGITGTAVTLLRRNDTTFQVVFSGLGQMALMPGSHGGVRDFALGGPGFEFPVYGWNGVTFVQMGSIADSEFPEPIN